MRKISLIFALVLVGISFSFAQDFSGKITYKISYEGRELESTEKAQLPTEEVVTYGLGKMKTEIISPMGNQVVIYDSETKETTILFDAMGQKIAYKSPFDDEAKKQSEEMTKGVKIENTDETKQIAGFKCTKAVVTKGDTTMDVWFTKDLKFAHANEMELYKDIDGLVLEYSEPTQDDELTMKFKASLVEPIKKIKKKEFSVPLDYKFKTKEELKTMFGGGQ